MSTERVLKNPRKRKKASKGHVIRVSDLVRASLDSRRLNNRSLSHDSYLRGVLGLPDRTHEQQWIAAGRPPILTEGYIEPLSGRFFEDEADANGAMIVEAAKRKTKKWVKPIRVRQVV